MADVDLPVAFPTAFPVAATDAPEANLAGLGLPYIINYDTPGIKGRPDDEHYDLLRWDIADAAKTGYEAPWYGPWHRFLSRVINRYRRQCGVRPQDYLPSCEGKVKDSETPDFSIYKSGGAAPFRDTFVHGRSPILVLIENKALPKKPCFNEDWSQTFKAADGVASQVLSVRDELGDELHGFAAKEELQLKDQLALAVLWRGFETRRIVGVLAIGHWFSYCSIDLGPDFPIIPDEMDATVAAQKYTIIRQHLDNHFVMKSGDFIGGESGEALFFSLMNFVHNIIDHHD
ncbi:hypothetical protein SISNIDRAFT_489201 [Sistotremastrum niveocremeum HHB9708]|uniref:Uncharacterized protein n=1 Tax=Sistotremastrum niveocremeum HHB9708 TaxID=1314777 RepID=A0A164QBQ7_9AGAM|nr:hypothetical protein SISNIDRAFT_489201 [Sistotremastrum niveocremeum HHB9708]